MKNETCFKLLIPLLKPIHEDMQKSKADLNSLNGNGNGMVDDYENQLEVEEEETRSTWKKRDEKRREGKMKKT